MKILDCNQIKIFINLEIIGEENLYILKKKSKKNSIIWQRHLTTMASKPNFYYIKKVVA